MADQINLEKTLGLSSPSPLEQLRLKSTNSSNIRLFIKRDDLIHPIVSGNKWRKLKYNLLHLLEHEQSQNKPPLAVVSFGGAWSNHLHALGWCCKELNLGFDAQVRGEFGKYPSAMIQDLQSWGTNIHWMDRKTYRLRDDPTWLAQLQEKYSESIIIPEGGSNVLALEGLAELAQEIGNDFDYICVAVGSVGTMAGLVKAFDSRAHFGSSHLGLNQKQPKIIGIPVVNGVSALTQKINLLLKEAQSYDKHLHKFQQNNWQLIDGFQQGGYAKLNQNLVGYIKNFYQQTGIVLEHIYTGKLLWAIEDLIGKGFFPENSKIAVIHSGGLQGLRGEKKFEMGHWFASLQSR